jgi:hypothetical protein
MKKRKYILASIGVLLSLICLCTSVNILGDYNQINITKTDNGTEYWGLLVGVSKIDGLPEADSLLSANELSTLDLKDLLVKSDNWNEDHIKILTGEEATTFEIMKGFRWLARNADSDDICLFYMTSMGLQMPDIFPKEEDDGFDECLVTFNTFKLGIPIPWISVLFDDQINFFLNKIKAQGICVIVESEFSGGYNDGYQNLLNHETINHNYNSITEQTYNFNENIASELQQQGRIIVSSCEESSNINVNWIFIHDIMSGLQGFADSNNDNLVSIEEAYDYARPLVIEKWEKEFLVSTRPQIFDNYNGELILTYSQLPPDNPDFQGPISGNLNAEINFTISSNDAENDRIRYYIEWGDDTEEWTDLYNSGEEISISHSWNEKGTFTIYFECVDEHGNGLYEFPMMDRTSITIIEDEIIDQKMTDRYQGQTCNWAIFSNTQYLAQSFIPQYSVLPKADLQIGLYSLLSDGDESTPIYVSIRDNLTGPDIIKVSVIPEETKPLYCPIFWKTLWLTVDFQNVEVIPGQKYYIVARYQQSGLFAVWDHAGKFYFNDPDYNGDPYLSGDAFISYDRGRNWEFHDPAHDFCFVTYGN